MLNKYARAFFTRVLTPFAAFLIRRGVSPDTVTLIGTAGVVAGALVFYPMGEFFWGTVVITLFVFSDLVDGNMARQMGRSSRWGAFLDSTLDRVADGALFAGAALYFAWVVEDRLYTALCLVILVMGAVTSYARSKADHLGYDAKVGVAERPDRLVGFLVPAFFADVLDLPWLLEAALWILAVAATATVAQRIWTVRRQALARAASQA